MADSEAQENKKKKHRIKSGKREAVGDPFSCIKGYSTEVERLKSVAQAVKGIAEGGIKVGQLPAGIMLSGRPGMGKTTLAKAFAAAAGLHVVETDAILTTEVIHALYEEAKKTAPSIVMIDDVDKIIPDDDDEGYSSDESRAALKELISQLDGLTKADGVVTIMTTNAYHAIDEALKRPGRIDVHIPIGSPTDNDRFEILEYYMDQYGDVFPKGDSFVESISKKAHGLSCAALRSLVNDVWLQNYEKHDQLSAGEWIDSFQRRILEFRGDGLLKKSIKVEEDLRRICYHESGHALVDYYLTGNLADVCVMQIEDNMAGGWTAPRSTDATKKMWLAEDCLNEMASTYGGMAAERIVFGSHSMGVSSDMAAISSIVSEMIYCFVDANSQDHMFDLAAAMIPGDSYTDGSAQTESYKYKVKEAQQKIMDKAYKLAEDTLNAHRDELRKLADYLYDNGLASGETMVELLEGPKDDTMK